MSWDDSKAASTEREISPVISKWPGESSEESEDRQGKIPYPGATEATLLSAALRVSSICFRVLMVSMVMRQNHGVFSDRLIDLYCTMYDVGVGYRPVII